MSKILIVEDEQLLGEMYRDKFVQVGFNVIWATEAKEALEVFGKEKPDIVLLDVLLPRENGIYFLEQFQKLYPGNTTPIIVFSNFDDLETRKQAEKFGATAYLIKSNHTPGEIVAKVKSYLK